MEYKRAAGEREKYAKFFSEAKNLTKTQRETIFL
jgi:hypothetical protein